MPYFRMKSLLMTIQLHVRKPLYRDYLRYLFEESSPDCLKVTRENDFGKALCSFVRYSHMPVVKSVEKGLVNLQLPDTHSLSLAKFRHCYYSREDMLRLNDLLEIFFHIDFDRYYLKGVKLDLMQKEIIESFIISRKLSNLMSDNETLKKRKYREELQLLKQRVDILRKKAWYRNHKIEMDPNKFLVHYGEK